MRPAADARLELETLEAVDAHIAAHRSLAGTVIQSVDLTGRENILAVTEVRHAVFLGCPLSEGRASDLRSRGAIVFSVLPDLPFNPYRSTLYSPDELYAGLDEDYAATPDGISYAWMKAAAPGDVVASLAMALHDHSISDALDELALPEEHPAVGIMGGHAIERGSDDYRAAAELAASLAATGRPVMTGGGPGAMEAANLGAALATVGEPVDLDRIEDACDVLSEVPSFKPVDQGGQGVTAWARQAFEVRREFQPTGLSIGIPTWFYGHEPPNAFASRVAKYFSNAIREDTLLWRCRGGIIYLPGAAGTVQEIFQAATGNYYSGPGPQPAPMVLVGREHWTEKLPAWPLLQALGRDREMGEHIHLVDSIERAAEVLVG